MSRLKTWCSPRLRRLLASGFVSICAGLILRSHYQFTMVVGNSMLPTLAAGSLLLVDKSAYRSLNPVRGDTIVARYDGELVVKRIVALSGEEVEIKQGDLYINGVRMPENHRTLQGALDVGKGKLLSGRFATLGDNRAVASAEAVHPIVAREDILGKVVLSFDIFAFGR